MNKHHRRHRVRHHTAWTNISLATVCATTLQAARVESQGLNELRWRLGPFYKEDKLPHLSPWSSLGHMDSLAVPWQD